MGEIGGFLRHGRQGHASRPVTERVGDYGEILLMPDEACRRAQAGRCMDCGVGFCQTGIAFGGSRHASGCPLHNHIPEWNDLVWRGLWREAYERLSMTNPFPEITGRVCPAPCEGACNLALGDEATTIRDNELDIAEHAFALGIVAPPATRGGRSARDTPGVRSSLGGMPSEQHLTKGAASGRRVAVVGSGPAGLACAWELAGAGCDVVVVDRAPRAGGLLSHGIPTMKLPRAVVERRIRLLEQAGVRFELGREAGEELAREFDAVVLATGATKARTLDVPGAHGPGVHLALDYLESALDVALGEAATPRIDARGKHVVVIGGGDTGTDCLAMATRQGAASAVQLQYHPAPPLWRAQDNPWPQWPQTFATEYGQQEAAWLDGCDDARLWSTDTLEVLRDAEGCACGLRVARVEWAQGRPVPVPGTEQVIPAELVLVARGFDGPAPEAFETLGVPMREGPRSLPLAREGEPWRARGPENVFLAGDARSGASLVVSAIADGLACARAVKGWLEARA